MLALLPNIASSQSLCFASASSSKPIRLQLTLPSEGSLTALVRYERGTADIQARRIGEAVTSSSSRTPAAVRTTYAELIDGRQTGQYVLTTQGGAVGDLVYSRLKDKKSTVFYEDREAGGDSVCDWHQKTLGNSQWVEQSAKTDALRFRLLITSDRDGRFTTQKIEVLDIKSNRARQLINVSGTPVFGTPKSMLTLVDANSDGWPDIVVPAADGGAGPNNTSYFYIYRPRSETFEFNEELSSLTQVSINPDHTITSALRDGCCSHSSSTYRYISGHLTLVESWEEKLSGDGLWIETTTGILKNGKLVYSTKRKPAPRE